MDDHPSSAARVYLPPSVESLLQTICAKQCQTPPDLYVRRRLAAIGEDASLQILTNISSCTIKKSLSAFIVHLSKDYLSDQSPQKTASPSSISPSSISNSLAQKYGSCSLFGTPERQRIEGISPQLSALSELEFRKSFLILSYIRGKNVEDLLTVDDILNHKDTPMISFESLMWNKFGQQIGDPGSRSKYVDWDSGHTHIYHCHVNSNGAYFFKGPFLTTTRTHLQRKLGDENVLLVKFTDEAGFRKVAEQGVLVGLRLYRFFVYKDGGKEEKKKDPTSSPVKCYFVRMQSVAPFHEEEPYILSDKTVYEARCLFMHGHTTSSMTKYMARFSLILSKTIPLPIDLTSVEVVFIDDIPCRDATGFIVNNEDNEPLIHTDGTGFISEDLAIKCPKDFSKHKHLDHVDIYDDMVSGVSENHATAATDPPLLMQCRLFYKGYSVKGTFLVNKKLPSRRIEIRQSMVKVTRDTEVKNLLTLDSLELVAISRKPKKTFLSKNLIALLTYGGIPGNFFKNILMNTLEDVRNIFSSHTAALRVAINYGEIDDYYTVAKMILNRIPLDEPYLQYRLSILGKVERTGLKGGKLPIDESFYLMGTADPTGVLKSDEVCVILENGQISGNVLVYRNPGLHFGDVHILKAVYVPDMEFIVGNAKYGIFFSINGQRSAASEIANGDFDGDMYWVSRNPQLLHYFKASEPWRRVRSVPNKPSQKPGDLSPEQLEHELFQQFIETRFHQSSSSGIAADSWLTFMDRLLTMEEKDHSEKERLKEKMIQLVDIYYDSLDAPKTGKKVVVPKELKTEQYPHFMERSRSYRSKSILGQIYDIVVESFQAEGEIGQQEIWKLPSFNIQPPQSAMAIWSQRYNDYRKEMSSALQSSNTSSGSSSTEGSKLDKDSINEAASQIIKKYKQILYGADEFELRKRNLEDVCNEAVAIYHVTYQYAQLRSSVSSCGFVWKVAGDALFHIHALGLDERCVPCLPSVLRELLR
ncbi:probable RNA-dependent RNA polymerase 5 [Impatiens glandulifera]|uniref:probable RNA-dependent RNA polymerase 5 n=1 Tax=Impatiens glandulifera TaxID=253017 RepID=UPI001FB0D0CB|nr:probable RNA-dependent RNA polymerase 5 [Impatiens glandulifera]